MLHDFRMRAYKLGFKVVIAFSMMLLTSLAPNCSIGLIGSQAFAQTNQRQAEVDSLYQQGQKQVNTSQYKEALQSFQKALIIYKELNNRSGLALTLNYIAIVERALGNYPNALKNYQEALTIFKELGDQKNEGTVLSNMGVIYESYGKYTDALELYQQALSIRKKVGDIEGEGSTLDKLGNLYRKLGRYSESLDIFQKALVLRRSARDKIGESLTLNAIGLYYRNSGEYSKALLYYQQALVICKELNDKSCEASVLNNIGDIYIFQRQYSNASKSFQQVLAIFKEIGDTYGEAIALSNIGRVFAAQSQYTQALNLFQQALVVFRKLNVTADQGRTLKYIGETLYKSGRFADAHKSLYDAMATVESLRPKLSDTNKISIFELQLDIYRLLQQVLIVQKQYDTALVISERGRSRAFVELLSSRLSSNTSDNQTPPEPLKISQIQQIAKVHNSTIVEYSIITEDIKLGANNRKIVLYIWVIKPTGEVSFRQVDLKLDNLTLDTFINNSLDSIGARGIAFRSLAVSYNPDTQKTRYNLKVLHQLLINPISGLLPSNPNNKVIFIPQSSLFLVSFPALQDEQNKYLIEKHTILTSPSIQVLDLTYKQGQRIGAKPIQGKDMLIVGNPTMPKIPPKVGESPKLLPALPGAEKEANSVASLFKASALIGAQATKSTVLKLLPDARFIHLATHGIFDDIQGLNSSIALAATTKDGNESLNSFLTAGEILDLKLNAELVVLSACDTGRGRITGDGVIGLSRSFITAGTKSVLVSLWSIPDAPTASLMTEFYKAVIINPDKAQALRQAMLTTMKQHPNPRDWAAFTLIGEAD